MFSGHVYKKFNGKLIGKIAVSDGRNVTFTDEQGAFSLPGFERTRVIFVSALTRSHDDWYIYVDGRESYDFYISPAPLTTGVKFLHTSDTEIGIDGSECSVFADFISGAIADAVPNFLIHTGDICRRYGLENHYKEINSEKMGVPVRYTLGNHDYVDDVYGEYTYERLYGPIYYSFDLGDVHFAVLPIRHGEAPTGYDPLDSYLWLENDIKTCGVGKRLFIFRHDTCERDFMLDLGDRTLDLRSYGLIGWQFGHLHYHFAYEADGVSVICTARPDCGGIDQSPAALRLTEISPAGEVSSSLIYHTKYPTCALDFPVMTEDLDAPVLYSDPVLVGDELFVATADDGLPKNSGLNCIDAHTGKLIYRIDTENAVKNAIAVKGKTVFLEDACGTVLAFDTAERRILWEKTLPFPVIPYTAKGVLLDGDRLIAGSERKIFALDTENGDILAESDAIERSVTSTSRYVIADGRLLVGMHWYGLCCYGAEALELLWINKDVIDSTATPIVIDGVVYAFSRGVIYKLDLQSGVTLSSREYARSIGFDSVGAPILFEGRLIVPTSTHGVVALDPETLDILAEYPASPAMVPAATYTMHSGCSVMHTPIIKGDKLVFAAADGNLYVYGLKSSELLHKFYVGSPIYASPVILKNTVAVADLFGILTLIPLTVE